MKNFSFARVHALLSYDWMLGKRKFYYALGIMFCIWLVAASISSFSAFAYGSANPALSVMINSASFFSYFHMAMVLVVTTLLTTKFITPRTSTAYITLPGSSLEKFVAMLADYAFGAIAVVVLEIVCMALLGAVGSLITGNMDWWMWFAVVDNPSEMIKQVIDIKMQETGRNSWEEINKSMEVLGFGSFDELINYFASSSLMFFSTCTNIASTLFYAVLVMCFKKNAQIKAVASYVGIYAILVVACIIAVVVVLIGALNQGDAAMGATTMGIMKSLLGVMYASPLFIAGFGAILYRQIAKKQAC